MSSVFHNIPILTFSLYVHIKETTGINWMFWLFTTRFCLQMKWTCFFSFHISAGDHPFECEFCGSCFRDESTLKGHKRIHTGEKPYECNGCGKKFSLKHQLETHYRVHTGAATESPTEKQHMIDEENVIMLLLTASHADLWCMQRENHFKLTLSCANSEITKLFCKLHSRATFLPFNLLISSFSCYFHIQYRSKVQIHLLVIFRINRYVHNLGWYCRG